MFSSTAVKSGVRAHLDLTAKTWGSGTPRDRRHWFVKYENLLPITARPFKY